MHDFPPRQLPKITPHVVGDAERVFSALREGRPLDLEIGGRRSTASACTVASPAAASGGSDPGCGRRRRPRRSAARPRSIAGGGGARPGRAKPAAGARSSPRVWRVHAVAGRRGAAAPELAARCRRGAGVPRPGPSSAWPRDSPVHTVVALAARVARVSRKLARRRRLRQSEDSDACPAPGGDPAWSVWRLTPGENATNATDAAGRHAASGSSVRRWQRAREITFGERPSIERSRIAPRKTVNSRTPSRLRRTLEPRHTARRTGVNAAEARRRRVQRRSSRPKGAAGRGGSRPEARATAAGYVAAASATMATGPDAKLAGTKLTEIDGAQRMSAGDPGSAERPRRAGARGGGRDARTVARQRRGGGGGDGGGPPRRPSVRVSRGVSDDEKVAGGPNSEPDA